MVNQIHRKDEEKEEKQDDNQDRSRHNSESSDPTLRGEGTTVNSASGIAVDPEKGKDVNLVDCGDLTTRNVQRIGAKGRSSL